MRVVKDFSSFSLVNHSKFANEFHKYFCFGNKLIYKIHDANNALSNANFTFNLYRQVDNQAFVKRLNYVNSLINNNLNQAVITGGILIAIEDREYEIKKSEDVV